MWSIGGYRGVISKIDSLFAIKGAFTKDDIDRFLDIAHIVLGEDDPALDLAEKDRWAVSIYGKKREFSRAVREGIAETLVLLAVHGKNLFGERLGFDGELAAARLVRDLLEPLSTRKLEANDRELPLYAEAAPGTFLDIIERDLRSARPAVLGLLRPIGAGIFGSCPRTGLLWALEGLAWNPQTFPRVVRILGRLCEIAINDNWVNKPISSLGSIFRAWMPQTAADYETRLRAIHMLLDQHPAIGWKICLEQFGDHGNQVGSYNHKPNWRSDGYGFGEAFKTSGPGNAFALAMVEIALSRPSYTAAMLCDLVGSLRALDLEFQKRGWKIIDEWHKSGADDEDIAEVREKIRVTVLSRRGWKKAGAKGQASLSQTARAVYESMLPTDVINQYEWLFRQSWVEEAADELGEVAVDFQAREKRIDKLRIEALTQIVKARGLAGVFDLAARGSAQRQIGACLASGILPEDQLSSLVRQCLRLPADKTGRDCIAAGAMWAMEAHRRKSLYEGLSADLTEAEALRLLLLSPYHRATWELVDQLSAEARATYWRDIVPEYIFDAADENNESVRRLLYVKRPRAAFAAMRFKLDEIRPPLLIQMLQDIAGDGNDKAGEYQLDSHHIQQAFQLVNRNPNISLEDKAGLELAYLDLLARKFGNGDGQQIPNLERCVENYPDLFVRAVVWAYKRKDGAGDPPEYRVTEGREHLAIRGHRLLEALERIPGQGKATEQDQRNTLSEWVATVRKACADLDRADVADVCLGGLFSNAPVGKDGVWPNEVVRDVMEDLQSQKITNGAHTGIYNARGAHCRGEGGAQERELANKYRKWADALQFTHPFVSSSLLMMLVKTYESEAEQQDTAAGIQRRLRH